MTTNQLLPGDVAALLDAAADRYGVSRSIARAIAWVESNGNQNARGTMGEVGVMQLMPATAVSLKVDPYDVRQNVDGGVRLLAQLVKRYGDARGVAAYNGGAKYGPVPEYKWPDQITIYVGKVRARAAFEATGPRTAAIPLPPLHSEEVTVRRAQRRSSLPPSPSQSHSSGSEDSDDS